MTGSAVTRALRRYGLDLAYLTLAMLSACVALVVWVCGLSIALVLAPFVVGLVAVLPVTEVFAWSCGIDRANARLALGAPVRSRYRNADPGPGMLAAIKARLSDPQRWRDLAWLVAHSAVGFTFGVFVLSLVAAGIIGLSLPLTRDLWPSDDVVWRWLDIDTAAKAWIGVAVALVWLVVTGVVARLLTVAHAALAKALLGPLRERPAQTLEMGEVAVATEAETAAPAPGTAPAAPVAAASEADTVAEVTEEDLGRLLVHGVLGAVVVALMLVIWAGSGFGYFWPGWVLLGAGMTFVVHVLALRARHASTGEAWLRLAAQGAVALVAASVWAWLLSGLGLFWPFWVAVGLGFPLAVAAALLRRPWEGRPDLTERVETLVRTRRESVDAQAAELRRIERDLHDGAQARLVSLAMRLGRAEARLTDRPEEAELIREAREEATAAIAELRDLARGIAPPVLADRGLVAAVEALCGRSALDVSLSAQVHGALAPAVESCAYFVCAEGLTNVAKHAAGAKVEVVLRRERGMLVCEVRDDGPGGADPSAPGLTGLRQRVAALDGRLLVDSAIGQGTTIRAELPCGS